MNTNYALSSLRTLGVQLEVERRTLKRELHSYLKTLSLDIESALRDIEEDNTINSNLMQHAASISERIGRWNLSRMLLPETKSKE